MGIFKIVKKKKKGGISHLLHQKMVKNLGIPIFFTKILGIPMSSLPLHQKSD